ncbi:MAG: hypothetical protein RJB19_5, partial [Pseudomonadota bacterium]
MNAATPDYLLNPTAQLAEFAA